jgi:hypothetical protein
MRHHDPPSAVSLLAVEETGNTILICLEFEKPLRPTDLLKVLWVGWWAIKSGELK